MPLRDPNVPMRPPHLQQGPLGRALACDGVGALAPAPRVGRHSRVPKLPEARRAGPGPAPPTLDLRVAQASANGSPAALLPKWP